MNENGGLGTAKVEFEIALQHKPDGIGALVGLGQVKLAEGDITGAIDKLEAAAHQGDDVTARLALGTARLRQGKHAEAARELRRVLATDPRNVEALSGLGQALLGTGQLEEAEATLRSAMQIRQDQATAIALGFTLARLDKSDQALSVFHGVLVANGNVVPALYGSGLANERLGRTEEALVNYRRVLAAPAEGPQKDVVLELQNESRTRIDALTAVPVGSASAGPPPTRPNETRPPRRP
jgi:tetratricopeptide (TPR) repeat protein